MAARRSKDPRCQTCSQPNTCYTLIVCPRNLNPAELVLRHVIVHLILSSVYVPFLLLHSIHLINTYLTASLLKNTRQTSIQCTMTAYSYAPAPPPLVQGFARFRAATVVVKPNPKLANRWRNLSRVSGLSPSSAPTHKPRRPHFSRAGVPETLLCCRAGPLMTSRSTPNPIGTFARE